MKNSILHKYLLASVCRSPDDPAAAAAVAATPSPTEATAAVAPAAAGDAAPAETAAQPAQPTPSLLEAAVAKPGKDPAPETPAAEAKPDAAAAAEVKPATAEADAKPADTPAEPPKPDAAPAPPAPAPEPQARQYDAFTVPEGIALDVTRTRDFTGILDDAALSPQERAQRLVDLYVSEVQRIGNDVAQHQQDVWRRYVERQIAEFKADPEFGGNREDTSLGVAKAVIEQFGGTEAQQAELLRQMTYTGIGNNLHMVRLLNNVAAVTGEGTPVPANQPGSGRRTWKERAYGNNAKA